MLKHRLLIAGFGIPLLILLCLINNPVFLILLFTAFGLLGVWEFYVILKRIDIKINVIIIGLFTLIMGLLPFFTGLVADIPVFLSATGVFIFLLLVCGMFSSSPVDRETNEPIPKSLLDSAMSVYVFLFFSVMFTLMIQLRIWDENGGRYLLLVFFAIMAGDSGAYFMGKYLGKHPLIYSISPKKTWEGVLGNFLGNVIGITIYYIFIFRGFKYTHLIIISLFLGIVSILSDLVVSHIKRATGVKDSGVVFPGHGGVLDRTDSILFSTFFVIIIVYYMQNSGVL